MCNVSFMTGDAGHRIFIICLNGKDVEITSVAGVRMCIKNKQE